MKGLRTLFSVALTGIGLVGLAASSAATPAAPAPARPPSAAEVPADLSDVRPGTVETAYTDGKLTVKARNAPLIDVLHSACDLIGARLVVPQDADEPVLRAAGPAAPRQVLAAVLNSSHYSYSIASSRIDPKKVVRVSVFQRDKKKDDDADKDKNKGLSREEAAKLANEFLSRVQAQAELPDFGDEAEAAAADAPPSPLVKALQADPALLGQIEASVNGTPAPTNTPIDASGDQVVPPPDTPSGPPFAGHHRRTRP